MKPITRMGLCLLALSISGIAAARTNRVAEVFAQHPFTEVVNDAQHGVVSIVSAAQDGIGVPIGSGFFVNSAGYLLTDAHVLRDAEKLKQGGKLVGLSIPFFVAGTDRVGGMDASDYEIVEVDDHFDIAILKATSLRHPPKPFVLSIGSVPPGTELASTGYPLLQDFPLTSVFHAATQGTHLASGLEQTKSFYGSFFLLDTPLHRGSSGSAVYLRDNGIVIGIVCGFLPEAVEGGQGKIGAFGVVRPLKIAAEMLDKLGIEYTAVPPIDTLVNP
jgi:S1-C subfamily serine protease